MSIPFNISSAGLEKSPDTLIGVIGAISKELPFNNSYYSDRVARATVLADAIAAADPLDACLIMESALHKLTAAHPAVPFLCSFMEEAGHWANLASVPELKAYLVACYHRLSQSDQAAFWAYAGRAAV